MDPTRLLHAPYGPRFGRGVRQEPSMNRRTFIALVSGSFLAAPLAAEGQPTVKVWRIGFLEAGSFSANRHFLDAFRQGLRELGYIEGQQIVIEDRWADGR